MYDVGSPRRAARRERRAGPPDHAVSRDAPPTVPRAGTRELIREGAVC